MKFKHCNSLTELLWQLSCSTIMARKSVTPSKGNSMTARKSTPLSNHGKGQNVQMKRRATGRLQKRIGLSNAGIGRLARRAGVKRIAAGFYGEAQLALHDWLERIVHDAVIVTEHGRRHTVVLSDMLVALKRNGSTLYGFGAPNGFEERVSRIRKPLSRQALQRAAAKVRREAARPPVVEEGRRSSSAQPVAVPLSQRLPACSPATSSLAGILTPAAASARPDALAARAATTLGTEQLASEGKRSGEAQLKEQHGGANNANSQSTAAEAEEELSTELQADIQDAIGDFMSKKHRYEPPGSVYKVHEVHSWMAEHSCTRRLFSPLQLKVVLSGLDEDGQVMLSQAEDGGQDLLLRFMM